MHCKARAPPKECGAFYLIKIFVEVLLATMRGCVSSVNYSGGRVNHVVGCLQPTPRYGRDWAVHGVAHGLAGYLTHVQGYKSVLERASYAPCRLQC